MRSYKIVDARLQNRFSFLPQNFSQVRRCYIFLNFQNFREMGSVKIANGKINLCAEREMAITFVYNWENRRTVFMCLKGTTSQDMYGSTPVAMYKEPVLRRSAFQAHLSVLVNPDTSCPVTVAALRSAFQALSTNHALRKAWKSDNVCLRYTK